MPVITIKDLLILAGDNREKFFRNAYDMRGFLSPEDKLFIYKKKMKQASLEEIRAEILKRNN